MKGGRFMFKMDDWDNVFISIKKDCEQGYTHLPSEGERVSFTDDNISALEQIEAIEEANQSSFTPSTKRAILSYYQNKKNK